MIRLKNVSMTYDTGSKAVRNLNLEIEDGEFVFIVGKSGAGKSTLFKLITRELKPDKGEIEVNGFELKRIRSGQIPKYRRTLGIIFQDFRLLNDRNVFDNVAFAQMIVGASKKEIRESVPRMLRLTGLSSRYKNMPNQLSGGEQQRVAIARALVNRPQLILADEPTGNLDAANSWEILRLLKSINDMGTTVIVVTHSMELVNSMRKRVIVMEKGRIVSDSGNKQKKGILPFTEAAQNEYSDDEPDENLDIHMLYPEKHGRRKPVDEEEEAPDTGEVLADMDESSEEDTESEECEEEDSIDAFEEIVVDEAEDEMDEPGNFTEDSGTQGELNHQKLPEKSSEKLTDKTKDKLPEETPEKITENTEEKTEEKGIRIPEAKTAAETGTAAEDEEDTVPWDEDVPVEDGKGGND